MMQKKLGFTLIEMALVLVIIGLIVGGIMVGQSIVASSKVRSQISQIDKYNAAVNTFYNKYGGLPGDLVFYKASQFGFVARSGATGRGDGDGLLEGYDYNNNNWYGWGESGETLLFWVDLTSAGMLDASFTTATDAATSEITTTSTPGFSSYFPQAKIGKGNYVYVYTTGYYNGTALGDGFNYFGLSIPTDLNPTTHPANLTSSPGLAPPQAYAIDKKIDDGFPQSGNVTAKYVTGLGPAPYWPPIYSTNAASDNGNTCFNTTTNTYSLGASATVLGLTCGLSFQFK